MTTLARIRLAIVIVALGAVGYTSWPALGDAVRDAWYRTSTPAALADEACGVSSNPFDPGSWATGQGIHTIGLDKINGCSTYTNAAAFLQDQRPALTRIAAEETARRRDAALWSVLLDLGKPMPRIFLIVAVALAAVVLAPIAVREPRVPG